MGETIDKWQELQEKINVAIEEWRQEHPEATLTEIEEVVDAQVAEMRTQMVQDLALRDEWLTSRSCQRRNGPGVHGVGGRQHPMGKASGSSEPSMGKSSNWNVIRPIVSHVN